MDILGLFENYFGSFDNYRGDLAGFLIGILYAKRKNVIYWYRTKTDWGLNRTVKKLRKTLKRKEKMAYLEKLFDEKIEKELKEAIRNDGNWNVLASELRKGALQNVPEIFRPSRENKFKNDYKDFAREILRLSGRRFDDEYKLDALVQELEKKSYEDWLPPKLALGLRWDHVNLLGRIRATLDKNFSDHLVYKDQIYNKMRGKPWWDQLLLTAEHLEMAALCGDPKLLVFSLFLQHLPACSGKLFRGYEEYFADEENIGKEFEATLSDWIEKSPSLEELPNKVGLVCKAIWNRRFFDTQIKGADVEVALCASLIRILNVATPYSGKEPDRKKLSELLKSFREGSSQAPRHVYTICLSSLISKVIISKGIKENHSSKHIEMQPYDNMPGEFKYLVDAVKALVDSEIRFIVNCITKVPHREKEFQELINFLKRGVEINWPTVQSQERWNGPDVTTLAESGLEVLANIDTATPSSSEIAKRFAKGLIVVLSEETSSSEELWFSVKRLIDIARRLRPQLGRINKFAELVKCYEKEPKKAKDKIKEYLDKIEAMTAEAARAAVNEIRKIREAKTEDPASFDDQDGIPEVEGADDPKKHVVTCFLFGWGGPLWETILVLAKEFKLHIITAPLRPVGEGSELKIWKGFNDLPKSQGHRIVVIADELIALSMKEGIEFTPSKPEVPKFALMGCEAYDQKKNVINSVGCKIVALAAHSAGVPFYIVTESDKMVEDAAIVEIGVVDSSRFLESRYPNPIPIEVENEKYYWKVAEVVEGEYVTGIITERGIAPKGEVTTCG